MIKTFLLKVFPLFLLVITQLAPIGYSNQYRYNHEQSKVKFELTHFGLVTVKGEFEKFSGQAVFDPNKIEDSSVTISIETKTVNSNHTKRDENLKSEKFFWSDKHPTIEFISHKFVDRGNKKFDIFGDLTIRGITHPVIFETEMLSDPHNLTEDMHLAFTSMTIIKRKDYELGVDPLSNPIMFITDEKLIIRLEVKCLPV